MLNMSINSLSSACRSRQAVASRHCEAPPHRFFARYRPLPAVDPAAAVPGTKMLVSLPYAQDRADVIAYLKTVR